MCKTIVEVIEKGKYRSLVRFSGDPMNSLVLTSDLWKYPIKKKNKKAEVEINLYEIHLHF